MINSITSEMNHLPEQTMSAVVDEFNGVPRYALDDIKTPSKQSCNPSALPKKIEFIKDSAGRCLVFFDGNIAIVIVLATETNEGHIFVFFYKHTLSMFSKADIQLLIGDDIYVFPNGETLMHWKKAILFKDYDAAKAIYNADDPKQCKKAGRKVAGFDQGKWDEVAPGIVREISRLKLQCLDVFTFFILLNGACTKYDIPVRNVEIVESADDKIYGSGLDIDKMMLRVHTMPAGLVCVDLPGTNHLGGALKDAWECFLTYDGPKGSIAHMMHKYTRATGKLFVDSTIKVDESCKRPKFDPMDVTGPNFVGPQGSIVGVHSTGRDVRSFYRTPSPQHNVLPASARTLSDAPSARALSDGRTPLDPRISTEGW